jgi:quercetin dioxygenase-like cupin family protein
MPGQSQTEILIDTPTVRVRILTLEKGDAIPWHHHTQVIDHTVCLEGAIEVHLQEPEETFTLNPGQHHQIPPKRTHTIVNPGETPARYLLIQGVGEYDFVAATENA